MSAESSSEGLRERIARQGEDALGKLAQDLLENPLVSGALTRAFEAREKASAAQEAAMGALNIPSAGDMERLTRRLRSVSQRLEGIEEAVDRLDDRIASRPEGALEERLAAIERHLEGLASGQVEERLLAIEAVVGSLATAKVVDDRLKALEKTLRGVATSDQLDERLTALENQLTALGAELARLRDGLPASPAPLPREQERFQVGTS
jgi:chromosome segregation ATPase